MSRWLDNFVVLGDAVYSFNPVYGQGMTVAAMNGLELDQCLREQLERSVDLTGLAEHFQKKLIGTIMLPWQLSTGEDLRWPTTTGNIPPASTEAVLMQNYTSKVLAASSKNTQVLEAFYHVQSMLEPPTLLFRPDIVLQVVATLEEAVLVS